MKKITLITITMLMVLLSSVFLVGCDEEIRDALEGLGDINSLELITTAPINLKAGETADISLIIIALNPDISQLTMVSDDIGIATFVLKDSSSLRTVISITAIAAGTTEVYVQAENGIVSNKVTVTVEEDSACDLSKELIESNIGNAYKDEFYLCIATKPGQIENMANITITTNHNSFVNEAACKAFITNLFTAIIEDPNYSTIRIINITFMNKGVFFVSANIDATLVTTIAELEDNLTLIHFPI